MIDTKILTIEVEIEEIIEKTMMMKMRMVIITDKE